MKVAVLNFAHGHADGYLRHLHGIAGVEVGACDPEGFRQAESLAEAGSPGGTVFFGTYEEAAEWADAVVVCSENAKHREIVEVAIAAGCAVLCEKPLATNLEDARAMRHAAAAASVPLMVAFPVRFSPAFATLRERVATGALGDILGIVGTNNGKIPRDRSWFTDPALSGGGSIVDHVVHCADLIDALIPQRAVSVIATSNRILHPHVATDVETSGLVSIEYDSGIIATIDCSWSQPESASSWGGLTLEVTGTRGSVKIAPFAPHVGGYDAGGETWLPYGSDLDAAMIDEFVSAAAAGTQPQPDADVGVRTVAIMSAALESARTGSVVKL
ncbi:MAG TPA: Gfo/Idh/MocA family oxidoreductase [Galbitalea sp.]|jgi:predicted dehydrogenase